MSDYLLFPDGPFIGEIADTIVNFATETKIEDAQTVRRVESQERRVESQSEPSRRRAALDAPALDSRPSTLDSARRGVTLIELLIVDHDHLILAALMLGVAAVAGETAREATHPPRRRSGSTRCSTEHLRHVSKRAA